ncbi:MAG TPA: tetratricopeptide repeat protein, partial [Candidatus Rifleibacterium sp.]|nr:tetratricopeptide repeat protein [Candidatus Rifleibacterium sp.]
MRRKFLRFLALCLFLALVISASGAEDGAILLKKSQLLVQKGVRAEERGEFEDAALFYEEALEVYPKNMMPLLRLGKLLARIGMYE